MLKTILKSMSIFTTTRFVEISIFFAIVLIFTNIQFETVWNGFGDYFVFLIFALFVAVSLRIVRYLLNNESKIPYPTSTLKVKNGENTFVLKSFINFLDIMAMIAALCVVFKWTNLQTGINILFFTDIIITLIAVFLSVFHLTALFVRKQALRRTH